MDGSWAVSTKKDPLSEIGAPGGGLSFWVSQWTHLLPPLSLLLYAILPKSQALHRKFTSLTVSRCWTQPLRHACGVPPPLPRGGFGSPRKVNGFARGSPTRGAVCEAD